MVYSLRMVLDSWLKQSTAQGSKLPEDQKQFVRAGTVLPLVAFELAPDDHLRVTLGRNPQGQQVQFQGRNTWFVYRPAAQILQNGQVINPSSPTPPVSMYSLRTVLDTWLKQTTGQGSTLPEDQRQFLNSGTILPLNSFAAASNDHLKVTLGRNAQGQQIFFKGKNTWFVYRPAVQILQNGTVPAPSPAPAPAPAPAPPRPQPSTFAVRARIDTWLKQSTAQGSALPDSQRQFISGGTVLPIAAYEAAPDNHLRITLGIDAQGNQIFFQGKNTWFVFQPAVELLRNGQPIGPTPAPAPAPGGIRQINSKGLRLLKSFEGLRLEAYLDAVGVWTIGYGTTSGVFPGQRITEAQAEEFLKRDLRRFEAAVTDLVKVPLNDDQYSALVSFVYNVGEGAFGSSTLLRLLNQRNYRGAADQLLRWNLGDGVELPGLTRRRRAERALFLGEDFTVFL